jgi:DNA-binding transcriptional regulator YiaG
MSKLASALKDEIQRLARKEIKAQIGSTKQASSQHRREIAQLKRKAQDLTRRVAFLEGQERKRVSMPAAEELAERARFSPTSVKSHRERLGLSAADYGRLVGVSALTIYNWEGGKSKPRKQQLAALVAVRRLGKREAWKRLDIMDE